MVKTTAQSFQDIRLQASDWFAKQDCGALSPEEASAFDLWLTQSPLHRAEYERVSQMWSDFDLLGPQEEEFSNVIDFPMPHKPRKAYSPQKWVAVAAVFLLAVLVSWQPITMELTADYTSNVGETKRVTLDDGTIVHLNTDSAIAVSYTPQVRQVELLRGQAEFNVAKDSQRPFSVDGNGVSATALGTIYDVSTYDDTTTVTVLESRVRVSSNLVPSHLTLNAGQRLFITSETREFQPHNVGLESVNAWKRNKLIFKNKPLKDVIHDINKYHKGHIFMLDPGIANLQVNGVFDLRTPVSIVDKLEKTMNFSSIRITDHLILIKK